MFGIWQILVELFAKKNALFMQMELLFNVLADDKTRKTDNASDPTTSNPAKTK
jgi:hypothetical protein